MKRVPKSTSMYSGNEQGATKERVGDYQGDPGSKKRRYPVEAVACKILG